MALSDFWGQVIKDHVTFIWFSLIFCLNAPSWSFFTCYEEAQVTWRGYMLMCWSTFPAKPKLCVLTALMWGWRSFRGSPLIFKSLPSTAFWTEGPCHSSWPTGPASKLKWSLYVNYVLRQNRNQNSAWPVLSNQVQVVVPWGACQKDYFSDKKRKWFEYKYSFLLTLS